MTAVVACVTLAVVAWVCCGSFCSVRDGVIPVIACTLLRQEEFVLMLTKADSEMEVRTERVGVTQKVEVC